MIKKLLQKYNVPDTSVSNFCPKRGKFVFEMTKSGVETETEVVGKSN